MSLKKLNLNREQLSQLWQTFDWEQAREGVNRESRARIVLLGLPGAGKSTLLNRLCGWTVSPPANPLPEDSPALHPQPAETIEDFGLFCLVDLPPAPTGTGYGVGYLPEPLFGSGDNGWGIDGGLDLEPLGGSLPLSGLDPLALAEGADLLIYVLDGAVGVQSADYRWVGRLRRLGLPLLVVMNKSDRLPDEIALTVRKTEIEERLATTVMTVSAQDGTNVTDGLLPRLINLCPTLTVALGRELSSFRREAAHRLIQRAALLNGLVALEPIPLIDLPVQLMTLTGLMLRIAALYDRPPTDVRRREVVLAIAGGLAGRYSAQQLAKLLPVVGWGISGLIGWSATWTLGRAAMAYFEAGGDAAVERRWGQAKNSFSQVCHSVYQRWQQRPRVRVEWGSGQATDDVKETDGEVKEGEA